MIAMPAFSASFADAIVAQLTVQGFTNISVQTTWLGRVQILALRSDGQREIILNPRTGEILRDLWTAAQGQTAYALIDPVGSTGAQPSAQDQAGTVESGSDSSQADPSGGGSDAGDTGTDTPEPPSQDPPEVQKEDTAGEN
ncbi:MAG: hypothetical protein WCO04_09630 [Pseudomonadota bacterium]